LELRVQLLSNLLFLGGDIFGISAATAALRRKKMHEGDLDKLAGMRLQLEVQVNTLESANMNANTLDTMRRGANALRDIHNGLCVHLHTLALLVILTHNHPCRISVPFPSHLHLLLRVSFRVFRDSGFSSTIDKVDATMNSINEQRDVANEISETISNTANLGLEIDEVR